MKMLTPWQRWRDSRDEENFHCDLILEPDEEVIITVPGRELRIKPKVYGKVHLQAMWIERNTVFADGD
jgi:hypothetical protein